MSVRKLTLTGIATLSILGGGLLYSSTPALAAFQFPYLSQLTGSGGQQPSGVAIDSSGDVYVVADFGGGVEKFSASGVPTAFSGSAPYINGPLLTGTPSGNFKRSQGVAVDASGDLYVVEGFNFFSGNNQVVDVFNAEGIYQRRLTGVAFNNLNGGVAVNRATGNVYVADENGSEKSVVDVFSASGVYQSQFGGGTLREPRSVAVNDSTGDVYVADSGTDDVYVFNSLGVPQATWTGGGNTPGGNTPNGSFGGNVDVAVDSSTSPADAAAGGGVYVTDTGHYVVDVFDSAGHYLSQITGTPSARFQDTNEQLGAGTVDSAGHAYVINKAQHAMDIFGAITLLPDVTTGVASNLQAATGSATLNGSINPFGTAGASYYFEYGADTTYGSTSPAAPGTGVSGNGGVAATTNLSGLLPNVTYHYRLDGTNSSGLVTLGSDQAFILAAAPAVNDQPPSAVGVTRTSVILSATVNPQNNDTFDHFVYVDGAGYDSGATDPYSAGESTSVVNAGSGLGDQTTGPVTVVGLAPGTTYHYALVASNTAGIAQSSPDQTFTTLPPTPPVVATGGAGSVAQNTATISATVNSDGLQTSYGFQIATGTSYGPATGLGGVGAGLSETVTLSLTGLQPGATYHYRIQATNVDGTTYGADQAFTTPGFSSPLTPVAVAPLIATPAIVFPAEAPTTTTTPRVLTNAQRFAKALKACKAKPKKQRAGCERQARKKYGTTTKKKGKQSRKEGKKT
jgi:DNA-binding beta-propeller fold protein YncE